MYIVAINIWNTLVLKDVAVIKSDISKHYVYLQVPKLLAFSLSLIFGSVTWSNLSYGPSLWHRESAMSALFSIYIVSVKNFRHQVLWIYENLGKTRVWVSLLLNLILYWWFLVNLLIPNTCKFALLVIMLP